MATVRLTQPEALLLEILRSKGFADEDLLNRFKHGDIEEFQKIDDGKINFSALSQLAEQNWELFEAAVREGHTIKFSTINGIRNLLSIKFDQQADRDYINHEEYLDQVRLTEEQLSWLQNVISKNWSIQELPQTGNSAHKVVRFELNRQV
jgi:hypothetical protein